jgi:flagellar motility protein MotE (MotC chaperone)
VFGAARSFAEQVVKGHRDKGDVDAAPADTNALPADASAVDASAIAPAKPAPVCAPSPTELAQEAGLSPAELQVLQSLGARRDELDQRSQGLDTQVSLIQAAEQKVDARIAVMNQLKADMTTLLGQLDQKQQAEVDRLVKVYEAMKPQDAAARFTLLTDEVRLPIAAEMKERALSAMLAKMSPPEAKRLTESLAAKYIADEAAARAAINPPPAPASAPPPGSASAGNPPPGGQPPPAKVADAGAPPADGSAAPPPKPHHKPRPAHHAPTATASNGAPGTAPPGGKPQLSAQGGPPSSASPPPSSSGGKPPAAGSAQPPAPAAGPAGKSG